MTGEAPSLAGSSSGLEPPASVPVVLTLGVATAQAERKIEKARSWYGRASVLDPDNGDFWALFHSFEVRPRSACDAVPPATEASDCSAHPSAQARALH